MAAVSNIYRAANVVRNHGNGRRWSTRTCPAAFTVLFVLWIWGDQQTRTRPRRPGDQGHADRRAGRPEKRGLARRRAHDGDGLLAGQPEPKGLAGSSGRYLQRGRGRVSSDLTEDEKNQLASLLRKIIRSAEAAAEPAAAAAEPAAEPAAAEG
jgi:hypothetical protein